MTKNPELADPDDCGADSAMPGPCRLCYLLHIVPLLTPVKRIVIHRSVIVDMLEVMREFGAEGWELLVLWLGHIDSVSGIANVVRAFVPKQKPIKGEDGVGYFVTSDTLFHLNKDLSETGLRLIAQVHSHPREAFHSEAEGTRFSNADLAFLSPYGTGNLKRFGNFPTDLIPDSVPVERGLPA